MDKEGVTLRSLVDLFLSGALQVYFIALNTYLIANAFFIGVFVAGFMISFIWTYNVKRIAAGLMVERVVYSLGAAVGGVLGLGTSLLILSIFGN